VLLGASNKSRWGYAASKMVDEFLSLAYVREFGLAVACVRLFNTVGPRQTGRYGMVIPQFVRAALTGAPIRVFGDGEQSRCFCHVRDTVRGLLALVEQPRAIGKVVQPRWHRRGHDPGAGGAHCTLTASASPIVRVPYDEAYAPGFEDMRRRVPDTTKAYQAIHWRAERTLAQILDDVIAYERARL
jgi:UDP-glucose 4-epimerase